MSSRSTDAAAPRPLDRALSLEILDDVFRVAALDKPASERSELMTIALREHVSLADAKTRMKWAVSRVWLNPPDPAAQMISWALRNPEKFDDRRAMHAGALLATVPFAASVMEHLGRAFALGENPTVPDLRRRIVGVWGGTSTVLEAVGKTVTSLRRLDIVAGGGRQPVTPIAPLAVGPLAAAWLVHATMLSRQSQSLDVDEVRTAPELFWAADLRPSAEYPYLEIHAEGLNRRVWATR